MEFDVPRELILTAPPPVFTRSELSEIEKVFDKWCGENYFISTEEEKELFLILCEYDHSHAPSNWPDLTMIFDKTSEACSENREPKASYKHAEIIAGWLRWFREEHPDEILKIILLREQNKSRDALFQFGVLSDYLFDYMIDYFC
jgi:hypothetical protein